MATIDHPECLHCKELFRPHCRNRHHQKFCSEPACRKASKAESQRRWLSKPENRDHFRDPENVDRVRKWRAKHPGYWKCEPKVRGKLQDLLIPQPAEQEEVASKRSCLPLQEPKVCRRFMESTASGNIPAADALHFSRGWNNAATKGRHPRWRWPCVHRWRLGAADFLKRLSEKLSRRGRRHESASQRHETDTARAERLVRDRLAALGWTEGDLMRQPKAHIGKVDMARRLRRETPMTRACLLRVLSNWRTDGWAGPERQGEAGNQPKIKQPDHPPLGRGDFVKPLLLGRSPPEQRDQARDGENKDED